MTTKCMTHIKRADSPRVGGGTRHSKNGLIEYEKYEQKTKNKPYALVTFAATGNSNYRTAAAFPRSRTVAVTLGTFRFA